MSTTTRPFTDPQSLTLLYKPFLDLPHIPPSLHIPTVPIPPPPNLLALTIMHLDLIRMVCCCCKKVSDLGIQLFSPPKQDRVGPSLLSSNTLFTLFSLLYTLYRGSGSVDQGQWEGCDRKILGDNLRQNREHVRVQNFRHYSVVYLFWPLLTSYLPLQTDIQQYSCQTKTIQVIERCGAQCSDLWGWRMLKLMSHTLGVPGRGLARRDSNSSLPATQQNRSRMKEQFSTGICHSLKTKNKFLASLDNF